MKTLVVLLPTLNEEKAIVKVIKAIPITAIRNLGYKTKVLVVDGGSTDKTVELAKSQGAKVITQKGKGKGNGFKSALLYLKKNMPDILVMLDADYTYDPKDIPKMILPIITGEADVVVGAREKRTHNFGNKLLTFAANSVFKQKIKDLCTGYWAFNSKAIKMIDISANGFDLESDLFSQINKHKLRIVSVDVKYRGRIGESKLKKKDAFAIIARLIRNIRDWNPLALFGTSGLIILLFSLFFGFKVVNDYLQRGYVVAIGTAILSIFLAITGFFMIGMALILDLLERKT